MKGYTIFVLGLVTATMNDCSGSKPYIILKPYRPRVVLVLAMPQSKPHASLSIRNGELVHAVQVASTLK